MAESGVSTGRPHITIRRLCVSSQVLRNSGVPLTEGRDDDGWYGLTPCCAARMEVAISAAMCSMVKPGGSAGNVDSGSASGTGGGVGLGWATVGGCDKCLVG